jgi:dihydroorotate dehydrogenase electron transfer subunit
MCTKSLTPALPKTVKVRSNQMLNPRIGRIVLEDIVTCQPGQFVMLWLPRVDEKPFSVDAVDPLTVTYAVIGPFTRALQALKPGSKIGWRGPLGHGFDLLGERVLVVTGGVGLASVSHLVCALVTSGKQVDLVVGAKTKAELYDIEILLAMDIKLHVCTDDGSAGFKGYTTQKTEELLAKVKFDHVYACGPEVMLVGLRSILDKAKISYQFSLERYMKCGMGICDMCAIDGFLTCQDGPIFNQDQIARMTEFGMISRIATGQEKNIAH